VELGEVEGAARLDEVRRHARPLAHVRQPADDAVRREDDVELAVEVPRQVVDVGADEARVDAQLGRQRFRLLDRRLGEVDAGDDGALVARPAEGVDAEVALEVQERLATHVAQLFQLDRLEPFRAGLEAGDVVHLRRDMDGDGFVPMLAVGFEILIRHKSAAYGPERRAATATHRTHRA
jgi:hypothetical protein